MYSAGVFLVLAAIAKLVSAVGNAAILHERDPILSISFRDVFLLAGLIELAVGIACLVGRPNFVTIGLIAWLASSLSVYRLGLVLIGYHRPCHCLGTLGDAVSPSSQAADLAMKALLAYLLLGSYWGLYWLRRRQQAESEASFRGSQALPCLE